MEKIKKFPAHRKVAHQEHDVNFLPGVNVYLWCLVSNMEISDMGFYCLHPEMVQFPENSLGKILLLTLIS